MVGRWNGYDLRMQTCWISDQLRCDAFNRMARKRNQSALLRLEGVDRSKKPMAGRGSGEYSTRVARFGNLNNPPSDPPGSHQDRSEDRADAAPSLERKDNTAALCSQRV